MASPRVRSDEGDAVGPGGSAARLATRLGSVIKLVAAVFVCVAVAAPPGPASAEAMASRAVRVGVVLPAEPHGAPFEAEVATSAERGVTMAAEELGASAEIFGGALSVRVARAAPGEAGEAARRLVEQDGAMALLGGFDDAEAAALARAADVAGAPFLNLAAPGDGLRGRDCAATTFHLAPSAAMYVDALAGWFVRAGFRRWSLIVAPTAAGEALRRRTAEALETRHFAARVVETTVLETMDDLADAAAGVADSRADLVLLLLPAPDQLAALAALDAAGAEQMVTGFPYPSTQTRGFLAAARDAAPRLGAGYRALAWEPTLDAYGARELNARFRARWDAPMDSAAWAGYQAVKMVFEAAFLGGAETPAEVARYLADPRTVFDLWKGIGASFRPWNRQMRQPLFLVKIRGEDEAEAADVALLVGELPAIYAPGTDPVERLDQIGDLEARPGCGE